MAYGEEKVFISGPCYKQNLEQGCREDLRSSFAGDARSGTVQTQRISSEILELILAQANFLPALDSAVNERTNELNSIHLQKILWCVAAGEPITLILPAFPAKSPNPRKTCGSDPDMGEVMSLQGLQLLATNITKIYKPGAKIVICSDGRVFSDLVGVTDEDVTSYARKIEHIIEDFQLSHLSTFHLENIFDCENFDDLRRRMVSDFARPLEDVRQNVKSCESARQLFNGIHRFILEDQKALNSHVSTNQLSLLSKEIAYQVVQRSNAWSKAVESSFPNAVRLSIHPQLPNSAKLGIRLMKSTNLWRTPWHSVAVFDGKEFFLAAKHTAEEMGAEPKFFMEKYAYFSVETV